MGAPRRSWSATPDAALAAVGGGRGARLAVYELYQRAHQLAYTPIVFTDRALSLEWEIPRSEVWRVLDALHRSGLAVLERAEAGTRRPSAITILSPFGPDPEPERDANGSQNGPPAMPEMENDQPDPEPDPKPDPKPPRAVEPRAQRADGEETKTTPMKKTDSPAPGAPLVLSVVGPVIVEPPAEPPPDWARRSKRPAGVTEAEIVEHTVRAIGAITGRPVKPARCGTDAKEVLALWRALGSPKPSAFADRLALVARAARECPHKLFARDIRAEGWAAGVDRSKSVSTLCVQAKWSERLEVAEAWQDEGFQVPKPTIGRNAHTWRDTRTDAERVAAEQRAELAALELESRR